MESYLPFLVIFTSSIIEGNLKTIFGGIIMKDYTVGTFIMDLILGACTGGIWWIYRIIKVTVSIGNKG